MAILNQKRILNLIPKVSAPVTLHVSQGDVGTEIEFTLVKGDELFVDTGNLTASVHGIREDGANFGPFTCTLSGSKVTFPLHSEMTVVKGSAIAEIVLVDESSNKVGSANFGIMVEESVFPLGVTYDNDVSVYESILAYVQTSAAQITTSLSGEISARISADTLINARIDQIVAPSGEAPNPAEVTDARIGVDNTVYDNLGNAIRGQISNAFMLPIKYANTVPTGSDYNNLTTLGNYKVASISAAQTMINCPTSSPHRLMIIGTTSTRIMQLVVSTGGVFVRLNQQDGTWYDWTILYPTDTTLNAANRVADAKATGDAITSVRNNTPTLRTSYAATIPNGTDYDTITEPSNYKVSTVSDVSTMINCPTSAVHRLIVMTIEQSSDIYQFVIAQNSSYPAIFVRNSINGVWTSWARILNTENYNVFPAYVRREADRVANKVREVQTGNSITFIAVSDMHYDVDNPDIQKALNDMSNGIKEIAKQVHIDFYTSFGDEIWRLVSDGDFTKGKSEIIAITKLLNSSFESNDQIRITGNHDPNAEGSTGYFTANQLNAYTGIYSNIIDRFERLSYGGVGYHDFERQKVRLIVLNTSFYTLNATPNQQSTQYSFGLVQADWLCQTLDLSAKADGQDWQIVVMSHINIDIPERASEIGKYSSIFAAYESGGTWLQSGHSYDFNGKNIAKLAAYINGHWHHYRVKNLRNVDADGNILSTLSMANLYVPNAVPARDYESMDGVTYTKTASTAESTAFIVVTLDPVNKIIYAHHYGAGIDIILHYEPEIITSQISFSTALASPSWNSNDTATATVSNGTVTPVANGNTMIWAKSSSDNCIEAWNVKVQT